MKDRIKILVVDDAPNLQFAASRLLEGAGYEVSCASSGAECLEKAREWSPDIVLLDIVLPDMDGVEVCSKIKSDPELKNIFVILCSGNRISTDDKASGLESGANDYIARPLANREFLARINALVRLKRAEDSLNKSSKELALRNRIAEAFFTSPVDEVFGEVLDVVLEYFESTAGIFGFLNGNGDLVCPSLTREVWDKCEMDCKEILFERETWGDTCWGKTLKEKKSHLINKTSDTPEGHIPIHRIMLSPILFHNQVVGILQIANRKTDYEQEDQDSLENIAVYIAPILKAFLDRIEYEKKQKKTLEDLKRAKEQAETANIAKGKFLTNMSHELRTPLTSIIGFAEVLIDQHFGDLNPKQEKFARNIATSGEHLLALISDILDLSKVEAGRMEIELSRVNIHNFLQRSIGIVKKDAEKKKVKLGLTASKTLGEVEVWLDRVKFKQIMYNLLSNAVKFTEGGGEISVSAEFVPCSQIPLSDEVRNKYSRFIKVSVADTGIGIAPEDMERIFDEFYQVKGGIIGKTPGTGLGLPLTKSYIEMQDGRIWTESPGAGKGSLFVFILPLNECED